jgi:hypothetical protein
MEKAAAAREVLSRCSYLLKELREAPTGVAWEAKYSGALALLRSVGHVLDKTDSSFSTALKTAISQWWKELKSRKSADAIFWQFVDQDRNLILKESKLRAGQSVSVFVQGVSAVALAAGQERPASVPQAAVPKANFAYQMNAGPFVGDDPRDLIEEAIRWWNDQLDQIEKST